MASEISTLPSPLASPRMKTLLEPPTRTYPLFSPDFLDQALGRKKPDGQAGKKSGPQRRRGGDPRTDNRRPEDVGLELKKQVVSSRAPVDLESLQLSPKVLLHGAHQIMDLER